ncbi:MAG: hypothetical protein RIS64_3681 [Bacteroidota bacterium]|jgi:hypothetical protein
MIKVYQTYAPQIKDSLVEGDIQAICAETKFKYDYVRRILMTGKAVKIENADKVIELAINIIDARASGFQRLIRAFSEAKKVEMLVEQKKNASDPLLHAEALAEIRGEKLIHF